MGIRQYETEEDEFNIKEIFLTLYRHKISIILITIIFTLFAAIHAYFKPNIFSATTTVEIGTERSGGKAEDILAMASTSGRINTDTEIQIIKSRFLAEQATQNIDFAHRYYTTVRLREIELYKSSPFDVNLTKGYNISFLLYPYDNESYRIEAKGVDKDSGEAWKYAKIHRYGEKVSNNHFTFTITRKEGEELKNSEYRFVVLSETSAASSAMSGVSVRKLGKYSNIMAISYSDRVPLRAQEFVNALADAYIAQSVYKKTREAAKTLSFVSVQLKKISNNLEHSALNLENFKKDTDTVSLETKTQGVVERLGDAEGKLATMEIEVGLLNALYSRVRSGKELETISVSGLSDESGSGALSSMIEELRQAVMKVKILRADFTEQYPEVVKLRRQIKQMQKMIIETIKSIRKNYDERKKLLKKSIDEQTKLTTLEEIRNIEEYLK